MLPGVSLRLPFSVVDNQNLGCIIYLNSRSIFALAPEVARPEAFFPSFRKALDTVFDMSKERRIILTIDEYPYLAACYKGISSLLQEYIDKQHESMLFRYHQKHLYLFAKSGFTKGCEEKAKELGNVRLIRFEEMDGENC